MNLVGSIRDGLALVRQARDGAGGAAAARAAYDEGAGLHGVLLAYTGATAATADDQLTVGIMERVDGLARVVSSAALAAETAAAELRDLEAFLGRLRGEALRDVLEK